MTNIIDMLNILRQKVKQINQPHSSKKPGVKEVISFSSTTCNLTDDSNKVCNNIQIRFAQRWAVMQPAQLLHYTHYTGLQKKQVGQIRTSTVQRKHK